LVEEHIRQLDPGVKVVDLHDVGEVLVLDQGDAIFDSKLDVTFLVLESLDERRFRVMDNQIITVALMKLNLLSVARICQVRADPERAVWAIKNVRFC